MKSSKREGRRGWKRRSRLGLRILSDLVRTGSHGSFWCGGNPHTGDWHSCQWLAREEWLGPDIGAEATGSENQTQDQEML